MRVRVDLEPDQYDWLAEQAGQRSIAAVVRDLIDDARSEYEARRSDPAIRYLLSPPAVTVGAPMTVATLDDDLCGQ